MYFTKCESNLIPKVFNTPDYSCPQSPLSLCVYTHIILATCTRAHLHNVQSCSSRDTSYMCTLQVLMYS